MVKFVKSGVEDGVLCGNVLQGLTSAGTRLHELGPKPGGNSSWDEVSGIRGGAANIKVETKKVGNDRANINWLNMMNGKAWVGSDTIIRRQIDL